MAVERTKLQGGGEVGTNLGAKNKNARMTRIKLLGISAITLIVAVGMLLWGYGFYKSKSIVRDANTCKQQKALLEEAYSKISKGWVAKGDNTLEEVMRLSDRDKSSDCLFVIALYYVEIGDLDASEESYQKFTRISDQTLSNYLSNGIHERPDVYLRKKIDIKRQQQKEFNDSFIGIGEEKS